MKVVFAGGGTGGHFYPIIATAAALRKIHEKENVPSIELYYFSNAPYDPDALFEQEIDYHEITVGKNKAGFSLGNLPGMIKIAIGTFQAFVKLFRIFPDVVFGKGGYASFPTLLAARLLGIPVVVHDSDAVPGRVSIWAGKFAKAVAITYDSAAEYFPDGKVARTGLPIRKEVANPIMHGAYEYLGLAEKEIPVLFIIGGSQGSRKINKVIIEALPELVSKYQIIHQTGKHNYDEVVAQADLVLAKSQYKNRYKPLDFLNALAMSMSAGVANLVISRAGSTSITTIALWKKPSILIPIPKSISRDQVENAFEYARVGGCAVIEEDNLLPHVLLAEVDRVLGDKELQEKMVQGAGDFIDADFDPAERIAKRLIDIYIEHEK